MSIYQKIRKSNLLKKTALEAAQAGAQGTGIDFNKKEDGDGLKKVANPITYKSSVLRKNGDPEVESSDPRKTEERKIVSHQGTAKDYIRTSITQPSQNITIPGAVDNYDGSGGYMSNEDWTKFLQTDQGKAYTEKHSDKTIKKDGKKSVNISLTPRTVEEKTDPTQTYNMDFKNSENANWAEGAQRRGTRRAERRAQRDLDIYSGEKNSGFLGLGGKKNKGKLSANVIAAAEKTGLKAENLQKMGLNVDDKGSITGDSDQNVTEQMRSRATNLSMNKYNQGLNEFNYKPGTDEVLDESGEGYEVYDGPVGDIEVDGPTKKGKIGKNAKAFKNKAGRGAGY